MKTLVIVGNGFDIMHKLPTSFEEYIRTDFECLSKKYGVLQNGDNNWNEIESRFRDLLADVMDERDTIVIQEAVDQIMRDYGFNAYGEINYYSNTSDEYQTEQEKLEAYILLLNDFEHGFQQYLKEQCCDSNLKNCPKDSTLYEIFQRADTIINFNYTETIEQVYQIKNVKHIHGCLKDHIVIGCENLDNKKNSVIDDEYPHFGNHIKNKHDYADVLSYYEDDLEGNIVENWRIKSFFDSHSEKVKYKEKKIFGLLDVKNKELYKNRQQIIQDLQNETYDRVYIIGHSLGKADWTVFQAINRDAEIICTYHTEKDRNSIETFMIESGFHSWKTYLA